MKRIAYATLAVVAAWLALEVITFALLSAAESTLATPAFFDRKRETSPSLVSVESVAPVEDRLLAEMQATSKQVLHPYLGFVRNPERKGEHDVNDLGFNRDQRDREQPCTNPSRTRVAIFGGSVALMFAQLGTQRLFEELESTWTRPCLRSFALAGYKQPQQLQALAYLLALGEGIDVVLNLDGFNELALPVAENLPRDVFYAYPRSWPVLVGDVRDPAEQNLRGEILWVRELRRDRDRLFSSKPFSYSALWNLVWRAQDVRLGEEIAALEASHRERLRSERGYAGHGPRRVFASEDELFTELAGLWERSSLAMHQLCSARGIPYYHVLQPNQYVPGSKPLSAEEQRNALNPNSEYKAPAERGYPYLREAGKRLAAAGVQFYDASTVFAGIEETLYVDSCCHFNTRGAEILASDLAGRIRASASNQPPSASLDFDQEHAE